MGKRNAALAAEMVADMGPKDAMALRKELLESLKAKLREIRERNPFAFDDLDDEME